jgi:NADH-quinone oxidoreductase subunit K
MPLGTCSSSALIIFVFVFFSGLTGIIFNQRNFLVTMLSIEVMYLGITVSFILASILLGDLKAQIYALVLLILAAAESAVGLGILIVLYRFGGTIEFTDYENLKGYFSF